MLFALLCTKIRVYMWFGTECMRMNMFYSVALEMYCMDFNIG